jgi:hypothetical protein
MTVFKGRLIFVSILILLVVFIAIQTSDTDSSNDKSKFKYDNLKAITLYDRGLLGNQIIRITDHQKVKIIGNLIRDSKRIEHDRVNLKSNHGFCELEMEFINGKNSTITFINTSSNGYIIISGDFHYRSDSLKIMVLSLLMNNGDIN